MPPSVAGATHFRAAAAAFPVLSPAIRTARSVDVDVSGLDPFAAAARGAVDAVFSSVLLVFLIPFHLKAKIEEFLDVL